MVERPMSDQSGPLARARRVLGRASEESVAYRMALECDPDADRETYVHRATSLTDGLEASIRDAGSGSFESLSVSRAAGPYSRAMDAIDDTKQEMEDYETWLAEFEDSGAPWLSSISVESVKADLDDATETLEELHETRHQAVNMVVYTVSFESRSPQAIEAIASEFGRLNALDGVAWVELVDDAPQTDPRASIDFRVQENHDR